MTDNTMVVATDDAGNEFESFGPTTDEEQAALTERLEAATEAIDEEAAERAREEAREQRRRLESEAGHAIARLITANLSGLRIDGKQPLGSWASGGHVHVQLDSEREVTFYMSEGGIYNWNLREAIRQQAMSNGHEPTDFEYNTSLGYVSGCELCNNVVRITHDGIPHVDAYNKRCAKAKMPIANAGKKR